MLTISNRQMDALRTALDESYADRLADYLLRQHPERSATLGAPAVKALAKHVVTEARRLGMEQGRVIARLATVALLVDANIARRPEVETLFAFTGLDADLKADLLCEQIANRLRA